MTESDLLYRTAHELQNAESILFITGAGISADSGLPTYRGIGGLYNDGLTEDGMPVEAALSGEMLRTRPEITWKYLSQIELACRGAGKNAAHEVIAEIEKIPGKRVWTLTQNIDGFHKDAGSSNLIEIHGNYHFLKCTSASCSYDEYRESYADMQIPPPCPVCGKLLRPKVVFFGEMLPEREIRLLSSELLKGFDAVVSIGTTSVFPYIAAPVLETNARGKITIEINPGQTEVSHAVSIRIQDTALKTLTALRSIMESL